MERSDKKSTLQKKRKMRNDRKKRKRHERALLKRSAEDDAYALKIKDGVEEQKVLAEKYYSKWKRIVDDLFLA